MFSYLIWHYGDGFREVSRNAVSRTLGFLNFFSVPLLARTIFSPWRRITDPYRSGFMPSAFFWTLGMNLVSRIVGAAVRMIVIAIGLLATAGAALAGILCIAMWLAAPILIFAVPLFGLSLY